MHDENLNTIFCLTDKLLAEREKKLAHKKTEDNTLNAPFRKYVETIWYLIIFYTFSSISFSVRAAPSGRAST